MLPLCHAGHTLRTSTGSFDDLPGQSAQQRSGRRPSRRRKQHAKGPNPISMPGDSDSDTLPGETAYHLARPRFPPWPLEKGGKTPPPDQGASGTPAKGLHTRGGNKQGNLGCVRNGTRCILLAHSCSLPNKRSCCMTIRYRVRQRTPESMAACALLP
jgi:hypothetical protein